MNDVVTFPAIPFWHAIQGTLEPGKMIEIRGTVPYGADCFQVNFTDAMDAGSHHADRILHISVRFNGRIAVLNSLAYGSWENEERSSDFPFASGQQFVMLILVEPASYKIAVNGQHRWEFPHRHAMDRVKMLNIDGTVRIEEVRIFGRHIPPPQPVGTCFIPDGSGQGLPFSQTITNPNIPFWGNIPGKLEPGKIIEIRGSVPYAADVFMVNLTKGKGEDIPLHISIRFNEAVVVRNSLRYDSWEREERGGIFPFARGSPFLLMILVDKNCYLLAVNGQHCWEFRHRHSLESVRMLNIGRDVRIDEIRFRNPSPKQSVANYSSNAKQWMLQPIISPRVPYLYPIPEGLKTGLMIYISGRPTLNAERFSINLSCDRSPYPLSEDIAFHFDPRFGPKTIVRNTYTKGRWGPEEKVLPYFPFTPGVHFDLMFRVESDKYMVAINGRHFFEYCHRIFPLQSINRLHIKHDVEISCIRFSI